MNEKGQCDDYDEDPQGDVDDLVYDQHSEMSSFMPVPPNKQQEMEAIQHQFSVSPNMTWPSRDSEPLSEFKTPFLATLAFPSLFPSSAGDPTNPSLMRDVKFGEKIKHLLKFGELENGNWVYRFARHPRFAYWALNMIQRKQALGQAAFFIKQNPSEAHLTGEELQNLSNDGMGNTLISKISRYVGNITGTNSYWRKVRDDLKAIITHVGAPTFFFTFSSADMHWPDLHALFNHSDSQLSIKQDNRKNLIENPHIADWYFSQRFETFLKYWLYQTLDADWHWARYEYQSRRGSIHSHGTAKLKNDPGLCDLTETALKGFLAEKKLQELNDTLSDTEKHDLSMHIAVGKQASKSVCQYVDWLVTSVNPHPPDTEVWAKPPVHPCKRKYSEITDCDSDYVDLVNTVQRHTHCSTSYCLKKKSESEVKCRFNFPFEHCEETKLEFEPIHSKNGTTSYRAKIRTRRNDSRLNIHQRLQLQGWRANVDLQVVLDFKVCLDCITKYASKAEQKSPVLKETLKKIPHVGSRPSDDAKKVIRQLMIKSLGEHDFSAQETMHHLFSLKMHTSSFTVIPVCLDGSRRIRTDASESCSMQLTYNSLLDIYANRESLKSSVEDIAGLNLTDFVTRYKVTDGKLVSRPPKCIPRFFPTYSSNPVGESFPLFCKYQLLRYKPWRSTQNSAWDGFEPSNDVFVACWEQFLRTSYAESHVPQWHNKLADVEQLRTREEIMQDLPANDQVIEQDEWMTLSDFARPFKDNATCSVNSDYDWSLNRRQYSSEVIDEIPNWIKTKKDSYINYMPRTEFIDTSTFSIMQHRAYDIVRNHSQQASLQKTPLFLIIIGVGGTGKSYVINALHQMLGIKCVIAAPTGKAAFNVKGVTLHSLLKLPVGQRGNKDLCGPTLVQLQENLKHVEYVIIDEYSMLGQKLFGWIDRRLRQVTGHLDQCFGGKSLILIGDPAQLPPVGDKPLYHSQPTSDIGEQGYFMYHQFETVVRLQTNHRVLGSDPEQQNFRQLLDRLRTADSTTEDWQLLLTRQPSSVENIDDFEDAVRLFFKNEDVNNHNNKRLLSLNKPIAQINAHHSSATARNLDADEFSGLEPIIFIAKGATVMLTMNIWASVGLCNGANGTVVDIIYQHDHQPPLLPIAVIIEFDNYSGPLFSEDMPHCVPICPVAVTTVVGGVTHERQQVPLTLAWAITIHKSQGLTLEKAWIDIGKTEAISGITYVALSRVRNLKDCIIEPMTYERLQIITNARNFQFRLDEERRLHAIAERFQGA